MRRAFTLVELLVALGLLSLLVLSLVSWLQVTLSAARVHVEPAEWRAAAQAVLQLVHDDLATGDFEDGETTVEIDGDVLALRTRAGGPVTHRYELHPHTGALWLEIRSDAGAQGERRLLLVGVDEWQISIDPETEMLTAQISSSDGNTARRRFAIP